MHRAGDLSSGTLYALKMSKQRADAAGKLLWDVSWVKLGAGARGGGVSRPGGGVGFFK